MLRKLHLQCIFYTLEFPFYLALIAKIVAYFVSFYEGAVMNDTPKAQFSMHIRKNLLHRMTFILSAKAINSSQ